MKKVPHLWLKKVTPPRVPVPQGAPNIEPQTTAPPRVKPSNNKNNITSKVVKQPSSPKPKEPRMQSHIVPPDIQTYYPNGQLPDPKIPSIFIPMPKGWQKINPKQTMLHAIPPEPVCTVNHTIMLKENNIKGRYTTSVNQLAEKELLENTIINKMTGRAL